ncbi:MAG TPA: glycosyltransferase [Flavipsychrobacter sp.]|nr:glycosyltransferase [Flavipsychrobacter sp.]
MKDTVAVVIPVKNGFPEIKDCITGWLSQTVLPEKILVIDSGSTDGTLEYLKSIKRVEVVSIPPEEFSHGATRNLGWKYCTEDYLLYTVQDATPVNSDVLSELLDTFKHHNIAGVCGQQVVQKDKSKNPAQWFSPISEPEVVTYHYEPGEFEKLDPAQKKNSCGWDDVLAMYRREVLEEIPFQPVVFGEDMIWAKDALQAGYTIAYNYKARVFHCHHEHADFTFKRVFTIQYFLYRHFGFLYPKNRSSFLDELRLIKVLVRNLGTDIAAILKWYQYNKTMEDASVRALEQFEKYRLQGEDVLDKKHTELCGKPPIAAKATVI